MYARILVPVDGSPASEQVLPYAILLASSFNAPIELLSAVDTEDVPESIALEIREHRNRHLEAIAAGLPDDLPAECIVVSGNPPEVILERAASMEDTLIAMATHGYTDIKHWLIGGVAMKVAQAAESPVLLVRSREGASADDPVNIDKIIVPLDGSTLAEQVLPHSTALCQTMDSNLILLRAYEARFPGATIRMHQVEEIVHESAESYVKDKVDQLQHDCMRQVTCEVLHGTPAAEIVDFTRAIPDSLITMCTHGRHGVGRWVLGSVTDAVIHHSDRPVLIVRAAKHHL